MIKKYPKGPHRDVPIDELCEKTEALVNRYGWQGALSLGDDVLYESPGASVHRIVGRYGLERVEAEIRSIREGR